MGGECVQVVTQEAKWLRRKVELLDWGSLQGVPVSNQPWEYHVGM